MGRNPFKIRFKGFLKTKVCQNMLNLTSNINSIKDNNGVDCSLLNVLDCVDVRERECSADYIDITCYVRHKSEIGMSYIR